MVEKDTKSQIEDTNESLEKDEHLSFGKENEIIAKEQSNAIEEHSEDDFLEENETKEVIAGPIECSSDLVATKTLAAEIIFEDVIDSIGTEFKAQEELLGTPSAF